MLIPPPDNVLPVSQAKSEGVPSRNHSCRIQIQHIGLCPSPFACKFLVAKSQASGRPDTLVARADLEGS